MSVLFRFPRLEFGSDFFLLEDPGLVNINQNPRHSYIYIYTQYTYMNIYIYIWWYDGIYIKRVNITETYTLWIARFKFNACTYTVGLNLFDILREAAKYVFFSGPATKALPYLSSLMATFLFGFFFPSFKKVLIHRMSGNQNIVFFSIFKEILQKKLEILMMPYEV